MYARRYKHYYSNIWEFIKHIKQIKSVTLIGSMSQLAMKMSRWKSDNACKNFPRGNCSKNCVKLLKSWKKQATRTFLAWLSQLSAFICGLQKENLGNNLNDNFQIDDNSHMDNVICLGIMIF